MPSEKNQIAPGASGDLRLVLISEVFYPELPGGLMRFFRYGSLLSARGIELHVFTVKRDHHSEDELQKSGILIHRLAADQCRNRDEERLMLIDAALEWQAAQPKLATVFQMMASAGLRGALKLWKVRLRGIPIVYALTINFQHAPRGLIDRSVSRFKHLVTFSPYRRIFALSGRMKALYSQRTGLARRRIEVIPNGVDLQRFHPATKAEIAAARSEHGLPENARIALYVGALVERKGVALLLEFWSEVVDKVPDAFLLIVGDQTKRPSHDNSQMQQAFNNYRSELDALAENSGVRHTIKFLKESTDIERLYQVADVFALPSRAEGIPNVVLEAMASGLPAIVSDFDGIPDDGEEFGSSGTHFLRCAGGAQEWASALASVLGGSEQSRRTMGDNARKQMEAHQKLEHIAEKLADSYRRLA